MLTYIPHICYTIFVNHIRLTAQLGGEQEAKKMIIESMIREHNYCSIVAVTPEHVYNAWKRINTLHFYILPTDKITNVIYHFTARIENGEIQLVAEDVALTLYSHDELINTIGCAFPDHLHDIITILETLLYIE